MTADRSCGRPSNTTYRSTVALLLLLTAFVAPALAQTEEKFFYWIAPGTERDAPWSRERDREEGFVVEVSAAVATRIENDRAQGSTVGIEGGVAAGSVTYNRNYFLPGHPVWNWHLVDVELRSLYQPPSHEGRDFVANPSDIARDLDQWKGERYRPQFYVVKGRVDPSRPDALANVSNRGIAGVGERTLITGFTVKGGEPRNIVVRALGPSLVRAGVQQATINPRLSVYRGDTLIARNDDWKADSRATSLSENYSSLVPAHEEEAALLLSLLPGAYTLHSASEDGAEGVTVIEAYEVDRDSDSVRTLTRRGANPSAGAYQAASGPEADKFYYWMTPAQNKRPFTPTESFVVEVNAAQAATIDQGLRGASVTSFRGRVAAGAVSYNRDYYAAGHPVWNWHVSLVEEIGTNAGGLACECPFLVANPSDIAKDPGEWIAREGDHYSPRYYWAVGRINPETGALLANVSNRGVTGTGERALITGFTITGGEPRNVVVRALGPSLSAGGVQQHAGNPTIGVYRGDALIASNDDWETDSRSRSLRTSYPGMVPTEEKEAALLLTLLPGAYTLHGLNNDGIEGVALLEAYDVDNAAE